MLFLQLSSNSIHFSVIQQKPIFFGNNPPTWDEIGPFLIHKLTYLNPEGEVSSSKID